MKRRTRQTKRWQFLWCDENSPPTHGDAHSWKSKTFRCATFKGAMDRMLEYVRAKPFHCLVDYECAALHVPYDSDRHEEHFPRIDTTEHELKGYMG